VDGDAALRDHFERCYVALHRFARHRGLNRADADDLVSATFEVAWRRRDVVPTDDPLPWLFAVAGNLLRNRQRSERRQRALLARLEPPPTGVPREIADVSAEEIRDALATLDDRDREVLTLVAWDGLTPTQVAVVLGCPPVTARSRFLRARRRLAQALAVNDPQRDDDIAQIEGDDETPSRPSEAPHG
jgi:RNA polymerase sigma-70 factor, ECF subfamily